MAEIVFRAGNAVEKIAFQASAEVGALPGAPAERVNDGLAVFACLSAELATRLIAQLVITKGIPIEAARNAVLLDLEKRVRLTVEEVVSMLRTIR